MRILLLVAGLTYLTGCQPLSMPAPQSQEPPPSTAAIATATIYRIEPEQTDIRILVYRTGPLASLGHNHVISAHDVRGSVFVQSRLVESSFELELPVDQLRIDDLMTRNEEGEDFSSQPSAADIEGTRENMLGTRVLGFPVYPTISITGRLLSAGTSPTVQLTIRLKNVYAEAIVPVELSIEEEAVMISGSFELSHRELGLEPFSVMMGALAVADIITMKFTITAARQR